jgi:hypothetical protein
MVRFVAVKCCTVNPQSSIHVSVSFMSNFLLNCNSAINVRDLKFGVRYSPISDCHLMEIKH